MTTQPTRGLLTSGEKWKAKRRLPLKLIALVGATAIAFAGVTAWGIRNKQAPPEVAVAEATPQPLTSVERVGVGALLNRFADTPHEVHGQIVDSGITANIVSSVTSDGRFGFGTVNAAHIDGYSILIEGAVFLKGSPTFWSALGVQTNFNNWIHVPDGFLGNKIFYSAQALTAALAPVDESRILGDSYEGANGTHAKFGPNGVESISVDGYTVTIQATSQEGVMMSVKPQSDAMGAVAELVRNGSVWSVNAPGEGPPPPSDDSHPK